MIWLIIATIVGSACWLTWLTVRVDQLETERLWRESADRCNQYVEWPGRDAGELQRKLNMLCPDGEWCKDNQGQIVFYTGLAQEPSGELKLFEPDNVK